VSALLVAGVLLPAGSVVAARVLVRAYARHARRRVLAALFATAAILAVASCASGALLAIGLASGTGRVAPGAAWWSHALVAALAGGVGLLVLLRLVRNIARVRTPLGAFTLTAGATLPDLVALDGQGRTVALRDLIGPRGALFVWYRGLA
jgi:hypothetical protein